MIHQLKLRKRFFEEKIEGRKAWELRQNDRHFAIGDYIGENEIDENGKETGRFVVEKITGVTYPVEVPGGLAEGYVILSTVPCDVVSFEELREDIDFKVSVYG